MEKTIWTHNIGQVARVRQRETPVKMHATDINIYSLHTKIRLISKSSLRKSEWTQLPPTNIIQSVGRFHRLTGHYTGITVAIGQNVVEGGLLRQTTNDGRLGKRAQFIFLLHVEAVNLVGETHHLS